MSWKKDELQTMDRKTRKLLTMHGTFHPKSDVDRLYLPRRFGGRGLISCEGCVTAEDNNLGWYVKHTTEPMLVQVRLNKIVDTNNSVNKNDYREIKIREAEQKWREKKMYGQFCKDVRGLCGKHAD